jgi:tetratricopeptide (TPR) repeat protein
MYIQKLRLGFLILTGVGLLGCSAERAATSDTADVARSESASPADPDARAILVPGGGTYSRPISTGSPQAQAFFDQGLRFAWGFYFPESIASHQEAARLDPDHPMPYWGMAHAMGPNPNSRYARMPDDPKGEGLKAITKAMELRDNGSPQERELIEAMHVLYDKQSIADDDGRDRAYLARMRGLNAKYPDDPDIAALYAASYMSIGRWDYWDAEGNPKGETLPVAEALEHVMSKDLGHPGVLHLHVHLIEASLEPERALVSADNLEQTVPIAGHVVHMPAHIYVRVGQYQRAIDNNIRSQAVDQDFAKVWGDNPLPNIGTYPLSHKMHAGHAIDFIRYAATVQGNYDVAIEAADRAKALATRGQSRIPGRQKRVAAPWLVHKIFGRWDKLVGQDPSHSGTPYLDGIWAYALGSAYLGTGDRVAAEGQLKRLQEIANAPDADQYRVGATPASAVLKLAWLGLRGEVLLAQGKVKEAISAFEQAVAIEDLNNYTEPPDWAQPMRHYLGAALLDAGRAAEAEAVFRRDLRWNQNNGWSLFGLYQALERQGNLEEASATRRLYEAAWQYSDTALTRPHF